MMKYAAAILGFAAIVSAQCDQYANSIPACASPCLSSAAVAASCKQGDYACYCNNDSDEIAEAGKSCVLGNCGLTALQVVTPLSQLCDCVLGPETDSASATDAATTPAATEAGPALTKALASSSDAASYNLSSSSDTSETSLSAPYPTSTSSGVVSGTGAGNGSASSTSVYPPIASGGAARLVVGAAGGLACILGIIVVL